MARGKRSAETAEEIGMEDMEDTGTGDDAAAPPAAEPSPPPASAGSDDRESIDNIRDILFGAQARQYEQRFTQLQELVAKEVGDLREEMKKSFSSLEQYARKEIQSLSDQLKNERSERLDGADEAQEKMDHAAKMMEKKISRLDEKVVSGHSELRGQILEQSKELLDEIRSRSEKTAAELERAVQQLTEVKTDRLALANLFMELSMRLKDEFKIPGME